MSTVTPVNAAAGTVLDLAMIDTHATAKGTIGAEMRP